MKNLLVVMSIIFLSGCQHPNHTKNDTSGLYRLPKGEHVAQIDFESNGTMNIVTTQTRDSFYIYKIYKRESKISDLKTSYEIEERMEFCPPYSFPDSTNHAGIDSLGNPTPGGY